MYLFDPSILPELSDVFATYVPRTACSRDRSFNRRLLKILELISAPKISYGSGIYGIASDLASPAEGGAEKYDCLDARGGLLTVIKLLSDRLGLIPLENTDDIITNILEYCKSNYRGRITLEEMEKSLSLSGSYISSLFAKKLGVGLHDYVNSLRTADACRLLTTTNESVADISVAVGFGTPRTFNRVFLESFGMSPREYRNKFFLRSVAENL
jgi:AraC-like DNA-binding protein